MKASELPETFETNMVSGKNENQSGFTLIEMLVVMSIIGFLSSTLMVALNNARAKTRDSVRRQTLLSLQKALELYFNDNGAYPVAAGWMSSEANENPGATSAPGNYIPSLVAGGYISRLPSDPLGGVSGNCGTWKRAFLYTTSNTGGKDYKLLSHCSAENPIGSSDPLIDPYRDGGPDVCVRDGPGLVSWSVFSDGGKCW